MSHHPSNLLLQAWQRLLAILMPSAAALFLVAAAVHLSAAGVAAESGGNLDEPDNLVMLPVVMAPRAQGMQGRVLKNGMPLAGKRIEIVQNPNSADESFAAVLTTDDQGMWAAEVDTSIPYEIRGFGNMADNEFQEWVWYPTPTTGSEVVLPDIDVFYGGVKAPQDGATEKLGDGESIDFEWSAHSQATNYRVYIRDWPQVVWRSAPTSELQTRLDSYISSGDYVWHVGMNLDSGWWAWSDQRSLTIDSVAPSTTLSGKVLKQGAPLAGKRVEIVQDSGTPGESFAAVVETNNQGVWQAFVDTTKEYEIRAYGDMQANEFQEWVWYPTPTSDEDVIMPDVDIYYGGLIAPEDGATVALSPVNGITFEWMARPDVQYYRVFLRDYDNWGDIKWWSTELTETTVDLFGESGTGGGKYMWHVGMYLDSGWWAWSEYRELNIK